MKRLMGVWCFCVFMVDGMVGVKNLKVSVYVDMYGGGY